MQDILGSDSSICRADSPTQRTRRDQVRTKIELDELYPMVYLFFPKDPPFMEKISKYRQKLSKTLADSPTKRTRRDQVRIQIELDELYRLDYLLSSLDPSFMEKNPKYLTVQHVYRQKKQSFVSFFRPIRIREENMEYFSPRKLWIPKKKFIG